MIGSVVASLSLCVSPLSAPNTAWQKTEQVSANLDTQKNLYGLFPKSVSEVKKAQAIAEEKLAKQLKIIAHLPIEKRSFSSICLAWNKAASSFMNTQIMLKNLSTVTSAEDIITSGNRACESMRTFFGKEIENTPEIQHVFLEFASDSENLTDYQKAYLYQQLASLKVSKMLASKQEQMLQKLSQDKKGLFLEKRGAACEIQNPEEIKLLQCNICAFGGALPLLFGGVLPWRDRIERIANKIKALDPDVICLQEVFDNEASEKLYEALKDNYAHFYMDIDPRVLGFDLQSSGFNSGLFVASKCKVENATCYPLKDRGPGINRALFGFRSCNANIYTSHYEAGNFSPGPERRSSQIQQTLQIMENNLDETKPSAQILTGDLNIAYGMNVPNKKQEMGEPYIKKYFYDSYNATRSAVTVDNYSTIVTQENATSLEYTSYWFKWNQNSDKFQKSLKNEPPEIVDYTLLLVKDASGKPLAPAFTDFVIVTTKVAMDAPQNPLYMLSDHQAMLSTIQRKS